MRPDSYHEKTKTCANCRHCLHVPTLDWSLCCKGDVVEVRDRAQFINGVWFYDMPPSETNQRIVAEYGICDEWQSVAGGD